MQSTFALIAFGMLLAYAQCSSHMNTAEYEIKQGM